MAFVPELGRQTRFAFMSLCMLVACSENEAPDDALYEVRALKVARIVPLAEALSGAHVPTLDPATMYEAEIRKALEAQARCDFRYTTRGNPVIAIGMHSDGAASRAVVKLNGHLVVLPATWSTAAAQGKAAFVLLSDPVRVTVVPDVGKQVIESAGRKAANAIFEVADSLKVGYRGYLDCTGGSKTTPP